MTKFDIQSLTFDEASLAAWSILDKRYSNWPVVYTLQDSSKVYVGETLNVASRLRQHLDSRERRQLHSVKVVVDESFNKSVCLDLESFLIRLFSGDGKFEVLNRNIGVTDADYFRRAEYQKEFQAIFEALREQGLFSKPIRAIENSDLFKLSPFKALTQDQAIAVEQILEGLFEDLDSRKSSTSVIQGNPGTGKTIVAIYLLKLLADIAKHDFAELPDEDSVFSDFFVPEHVPLIANLKFGLVVPQQSLRESIQKVFAKTPGLSKAQVMTPYQVGESDTAFDLLVVDEAHRLNQRANQASAALNKKFSNINLKLFGDDHISHTQLDWITAQSQHQIFLIDTQQSVRPADLPIEVANSLIRSAATDRRLYVLTSQMRVRASEDYVGYVRDVLAGKSVRPQRFAEYDLRLFDSVAQMYDELKQREEQFGLARLVAGYAWPWRSKNDPSAFDIELDGLRCRWNSTTKDWVNSPNSINEVGSIHTTQGYDLNYAGVIIGNDLRYDPRTGKIIADRTSYFDAKGKENNPRKGKEYSDEELCQFITNIYAVLLTRGIRGTYIYITDARLKAQLRPYFANIP